jgi:ABC-type phosphate transport system substrate-binding protein
MHKSLTPRSFLRILYASLLLASSEQVSAASLDNNPTSRGFLVIVHPSNQQTSITREQLMQAFFKRSTRWKTGEPIRPVDLRPDSPARYAFSDQVLKRSVASVRTYWQQRIFSGRELPPPELENDAEVLQFVQLSPGSIGYVSANTQLSAAVKLIPMQ